MDKNAPIRQAYESPHHRKRKKELATKGTKNLIPFVPFVANSWPLFCLLAFRCVVTLLVADFQLNRFSVVVDVHWRNFNAQLVEFAVVLPVLGNKPEAVFVAKICADGLIDASVFALEAWKPGSAAGGFRERSHDVVCLKKRNLRQRRTT